jgi:KipI family sensor histidine kinase inhibitor
VINVELYPLGDQGIVVRFGDQWEEQVNERVQRLKRLLENDPPLGFMELVPSYATLTVYYHPWPIYSAFRWDEEDGVGPYEWMHEQLLERIQRIEPNELTKQTEQTGHMAMVGRQAETETEGRTVTIPVTYGGEWGPDLAEVAERAGLSVEEAISLHASVEYHVAMIGFAPGFPYLAGLPNRLASPRKATPRHAVPAGSVGIAGVQTGIYPLSSPGGWQLIGRTSEILFDPYRNPPSLLAPGDRVRFIPIRSGEMP